MQNIRSGCIAAALSLALAACGGGGGGGTAGIGPQSPASPTGNQAESPTSSTSETAPPTASRPPDRTESQPPDLAEGPTPDRGNNPTPDPGNNPTPDPGDNPSPDPGNNPTPDPGNNPTPDPGNNPTPDPGDNPTPDPGDNPTPDPGDNPTPPEPRISLSEQEHETYEAGSDQGRAATLKAVETDPRFGSVTQSSNAEPNTEGDGSTTTDRASAAYEDGKLTVTVTQQDNSSFTFNTMDDAVDSESSTSAANGLKITSTTYVKAIGAGDEMETILAHTAHFSTGEEATDWMAGGYWLKLAGDIGAGTIDNVEVGAFVDGPELRETQTLSVDGSATYKGEANGLYTAVYGAGADEPEGSYEFGRYQGDVDLLAHFGSWSSHRHGHIGGTIRNIGIAGVLVRDGSVQASNVERMTDYQVNLGIASIKENGRFSSADVALFHPGTKPEYSGSWSGQVSNRIDDADGIPRLVAGTNGITATLPGGTTTSMVGSFYGWKVITHEE